MTELALGLLAGTWGPQAMEVTAPLLGQWSQLGNKVEDNNISNRPLQTFFALLLASLLTAYWEPWCVPVKRCLWWG